MEIGGAADVTIEGCTLQDIQATGKRSHSA